MFGPSKTDLISPRWRALLTFGILAGLSVLFTVVVVQASIRHGKLGLPATYDDVGYCADGLKRLYALYDGGVLGLLASLKDSPPHAPVATAMAFLGFLLFGVHDWAPYLIDAVIVLCFLLFVWAIVKSLRPLHRAICVGVAVTLPITMNAVNEFKPDIFCGLVTTIGAIFIARTAFRNGSGRALLCGSSLLAAALLIKPTFVGATLLFTGLSGLFGLVGRAFVKQKVSTLVTGLWRLAALFAAGIVIVLPYYLLVWRRLYAYIVENSYGANKDIWAIKTDLVGHAEYFVIGPGGYMMLGRHLLAIAVAIGCGCLAAVIARRRVDILRHAYFFAMCVLTYLLPTSMEVKNPFSAVQFHYMLVFWALYSYACLFRRPVGRRAVAILRPVRVLAVVAFLVSMFWLRFPIGATGADAIIRNRLAHQDFVLIRDRAVTRVLAGDTRPVSVTLTTAGQSHNPSALDFMLLKEGIRNVQFHDVHRERSLAAYAAAFNASDIVIANDPNNEEAFDWLPSGKVQAETLSLIRNSPDFYLSATNETIAKRKYYVFERAAGFSERIHLAGFAEPEGPYPQWHLPQVRWGLGPKSTLTIVPDGQKRVRLVLSAMCYRPNQSVAIQAGGRVLAHHSFARPGQFDTIVLPLELGSAEMTLELSYGIWEPATAGDGRSRALLFRAVQLIRDSAG